MDGSGTGLPPSRGTSPDDWTEAKASSFRAADDVTEAPAHPHPRSPTKSLRGPSNPDVHPRSVSLPQALSSFTLSKRTAFAKVPRISLSPTKPRGDQPASPAESPEDSLTMSKEQTLQLDRHPCNNTVVTLSDSKARGTLDTTKQSEEISPSSSINLNLLTTSKRATSESYGNTPIEALRGHGTARLPHSSPKLVRSGTTPHVADILYNGEAQLLDPLPDVAHSLRSGKSLGFQGRATEQQWIESSLPRRDHFKNLATSPEACGFAEETRLLATQRALSNPDILFHIFEALDSMTVIPHELVQQRRKPVSLRHAQLVYGDNERAIEAWEKAPPTTTATSPGSGLFNCLLVNSTWFCAAVRVLEDRLHFQTNQRWTQFARRGVSSLSRKPRMLVLHKLNEATQVELDMIDSFDLGEHLEWLEFYTCVGLAPPASLLGSQLTRIILPGCYRVNDRTLSLIASKCSHLEHLDVRACEQVSDRGIKMISKFCRQLQLINVGRTRSGENITYKGIKHLARQTQVTTLGVAGCHIDDRAIWELALNRGPKLQRLSLNNCKLLTDASVPRVLGYMPNLTVLEIRGCTQITYMRPIALFKAFREKQGQPPLIEGCELIERRLRLAMIGLQREVSQRILNDLGTWINCDTEEDEQTNMTLSSGTAL